MILSKYFLEVESAKEFEEQAMQMFNYANNPDLIDAAIHFAKGAEIMQKYLISKSIADHKAEDIKIIHYKTLLEKLKGRKKK